jgi:hypothetical protein
MALAFRSVFVKITDESFGRGDQLQQTASFGSPSNVVVRAADCAIKSFHVGFRESDHNIFFERIAIHNVILAASEVFFDVFAKLRDDTDDPNMYDAEVEVLVIADVDHIPN